MINAVELDMLMKELKDLREENLRLKAELLSSNKRIKLLESEVGWAENGYNKNDK
jgi:predicted nuclease with TOPRIM domain